MAEAYIVGAVRTPVGKRNGGLSALNPVDRQSGGEPSDTVWV